MAASHTVNYLNEKDNTEKRDSKKNSFRIFQFYLDRGGRQIKLADQNDIIVEYDLLEILFGIDGAQYAQAFCTCNGR